MHAAFISIIEFSFSSFFCERTSQECWLSRGRCRARPRVDWGALSLNRKGLHLRYWLASSELPLCLHRRTFERSAPGGGGLGQCCFGQTAKGANDRAEESLMERWANTSEGGQASALEMKPTLELTTGWMLALPTQHKTLIFIPATSHPVSDCIVFAGGLKYQQRCLLELEKTKQTKQRHHNKGQCPEGEKVGRQPLSPASTERKWENKQEKAFITCLCGQQWEAAAEGEEEEKKRRH